MSENIMVRIVVIFLIQKLIWNKIEYEFLQMEKSHLNLTICNGIKQKNPKINRLSCSLVRFFSEFLDQLFHQPQLLMFTVTVNVTWTNKKLIVGKNQKIK